MSARVSRQRASISPARVPPVARMPISSGVTVGSLVKVCIESARVDSTVARPVESGTVYAWLVVGGVGVAIAGAVCGEIAHLGGILGRLKTNGWADVRGCCAEDGRVGDAALT